MVIDHLPPLKEEHYARGQVLGNNLNMITHLCRECVPHVDQLIKDIY